MGWKYPRVETHFYSISGSSRSRNTQIFELVRPDRGSHSRDLPLLPENPRQTLSYEIEGVPLGHAHPLGKGHNGHDLVLATGYVVQVEAIGPYCLDVGVLGCSCTTQTPLVCRPGRRER